MDARSYATYFDHTLLRANATEGDIRTLADEAIKHGFFGVCVNSSFIPLVAKLTSGSPVKPLAVVGFPLGAMATDAKVFETSWSVDHGAQEIDMVLEVGRLIDLTHDAYVANDIAAVVKAAGKAPVKVIIETAYLSQADIRRATSFCVDAGAAFVKTSTGFASRGASFEDVICIREELRRRGDVAKSMQIKASGGIKTAKDFLAYLDLGVTRIGTSNGISILNELTGVSSSSPASTGY